MAFSFGTLVVQRPPLVRARINWSLPLNRAVGFFHASVASDENESFFPSWRNQPLLAVGCWWSGWVRGSVWGVGGLQTFVSGLTGPTLGNQIPADNRWVTAARWPIGDVCVCVFVGICQQRGPKSVPNADFYSRGLWPDMCGSHIPDICRRNLHGGQVILMMIDMG